jgi:hypothetical protein
LQIEKLNKVMKGDVHVKNVPQLLLCAYVLSFVPATIASKVNGESERSKATSLHGANALRYLQDNSVTINTLSTKLNRTSDQIRSLFLSDSTLHLHIGRTDDSSKTPETELFYMEDLQNLTEFEYSPSSPTRREIGDVFKLHSSPSSSKVIYLDFDGHIIQGTAWNEGNHPNITAPPIDWDGSPSTFSATEQAYIQEIWARVAEDFMPFDIDVTTEYMGGNEDFLVRSSPSDQEYGLRVLISPGIMPILCSCGGISYVSIYGRVGIDYYMPSLVFPDGLGNSPKCIAEAVSHEAGHALGLHHDGTASTGYYSGHGGGETGWAPIMGVSFDRPLAQWSRGEYAGANNQEDDLAIIAASAPYRPDDFNDTVAAAAASALVSAGPALAAAGVIGHTGDVDVFPFAAAAAGVMAATAAPASAGPNLDILLQLINASGAVLASANPAGALAATLTFTLPEAGRYYLAVSGVGAGDPAGTGYPSYGSLGQYTLTGDVQPLASSATVVAGQTSTTATATSESSTATSPGQTSTDAAGQTSTDAVDQASTARATPGPNASSPSTPEASTVPASTPPPPTTQSPLTTTQAGSPSTAPVAPTTTAASADPPTAPPAPGSSLPPTAPERPGPSILPAGRPGPDSDAKSTTVPGSAAPSSTPSMLGPTDSDESTAPTRLNTQVPVQTGASSSRAALPLASCLTATAVWVLGWLFVSGLHSSKC